MRFSRSRMSRPQVGGPRLPVDRAFTQRGFGTVVTGTLAGGPLDVGDMVHLYPGGARTRVRGLQTHRAAAERAWPGRRVAVNLGGVAPSDVPRGTVVAAPGAVTETRRVDATLRLLPSAPRALKPGERVSWHSGPPRWWRPCAIWRPTPSGRGAPAGSSGGLARPSPSARATLM